MQMKRDMTFQISANFLKVLESQIRERHVRLTMKRGECKNVLSQIEEITTLNEVKEVRCL